MVMVERRGGVCSRTSLMVGMGYDWKDMARLVEGRIRSRSEVTHSAIINSCPCSAFTTVILAHVGDCAV